MLQLRRRQRYRRRRRRRQRLIGRGISRPYVDKRNRLMLASGSRKKTFNQRGGFFPILAALNAAGPVIDLLGKVIK